MFFVFVGCGLVVRRVWVSDEVYELLLKRKGKGSFSQVIKGCLGVPEKKERSSKQTAIIS